MSNPLEFMWTMGQIAVYGFALNVAYKTIYQHFMVAKANKIRLDEMQAAAARHIPSDQNGRNGLLVFGRAKNGQPIIRNIDNDDVLTPTATVALDEMTRRMDRQERALLALAQMSGSAAQLKELLPELPAPQLPTMIGGEQAFSGRTMSLERLLIGFELDADGNLAPVEMPLGDMMHTLGVGMSGWGKSSWLSMLLYQIARAKERCTVVAIDISGSEFNVLKNWNRLAFPLGRTVRDAVGQLEAVSVQVGTRRDLYAETTATNLNQYNEYAAQVGKEQLEPWLVVIDEGTHLLNQDGTSEPLREVMQTARQYGVYALLTGQSAKHNVVDTQIRDQFSTRIGFKMPPSSSRVVLEDASASELNVKGRAMLIRPGKEMTTIQSPFIDRNTFVSEMAKHQGRPRDPQPVASVAIQYHDPSDNEIVDYYLAGNSRRQCELKFYGYAGGQAAIKVRKAIQTINQ